MDKEKRLEMLRRETETNKDNKIKERNKTVFLDIIWKIPKETKE